MHISHFPFHLKKIIPCMLPHDLHCFGKQGAVNNFLNPLILIQCKFGLTGLAIIFALQPKLDSAINFGLSSHLYASPGKRAGEGYWASLKHALMFPFWALSQQLWGFFAWFLHYRFRKAFSYVTKCLFHFLKKVQLPPQSAAIIGP